MARIVEYETVLQTLLGQGLKSLYYNSGSFGFTPGIATQTVGWLGPPDPTIRPEALPFTRQVPQPYIANLVQRTEAIWRNHMPGPLWALPRSHWAYELDFGSKEWMPEALRKVGIDPAALEPRTTGDAIEFSIDEFGPFNGFLETLLNHLSGSSDFQLIWPGRPVACMVHHHQQLWWTTTDDGLYAAVEKV